MKIKLLIAILVICGVGLAQSFPYPLHGTTTPGSVVTASGQWGTKSTTSNANGEYQIELDSGWIGSQISINANGCPFSIMLPKGQGFPMDLPCSNPVPNPQPIPQSSTPIAPIAGAAIVVIAGAVVIIKRRRGRPKGSKNKPKVKQ